MMTVIHTITDRDGDHLNIEESDDGDTLGFTAHSGTRSILIYVDREDAGALFALLATHLDYDLTVEDEE